MEFVTVNGVEIAYEFLGTGDEPMVIIGGSGLGRQNLDPLLPYFVDDYKILSFDQRGYGESQALEHDQAGIEMWADDIPALMDAVGWETAHINSTSFGSMVGLALALRHPERCRSLVAQGFFAKPDVARTMMLEAWDDHSRAAGWSRGFAAHISTDALKPEYLEENPDVLDTMLSMLRQTPLKTWHAAHHAMRTLNLTEGLETCPVPTLVMSGELDWVTPLDMEASGVGARRVAELLPNARLVVFPGVGHVTIMERTEEHAQEIRTFLAELEGRAVAGRR
jgi:pimeloyl-ACP methyl ester carboxylesterase